MIWSAKLEVYCNYLEIYIFVTSSGIFFYLVQEKKIYIYITRSTSPGPKSNRINLCKIIVYFARKNIFFSILHTHFYKTSTSIYLFYHLFYLNNNISLIFYYIKQTTIHMAPPTFFFLSCEKKTDERATWRGERKKE